MAKFAKDPYQIEYAQIIEAELIREGNWNGWDFTPEMFEEIVETYDLSLLRAPIQRTHWGDGSGPVFGHVLDVEVRDTGGDLGKVSLWSTLGILPEGVYEIESGQVNERSVSISSWHPTSGFDYLIHLMLISDSNPAVTGMEPIKLSPIVVEEVEMTSAIEDPVFAKVLNYNPKNLNWSKDDDDIKYRIRETSRFEPDTFDVIPVSAKAEGVRAEVGILKPQYLPEGSEPDALFARYYFFPLKNDWDIRKAKSWISRKRVLESLNIVNNLVEVGVKVISTLAGTENINAAAKAEGGKLMTEEEKAAAEAEEKRIADAKAKVVADAALALAADPPSPKPSGGPEIIRIQDKSIPDVMEINRGLMKEKDASDQAAIIALETENYALQKQILENRKTYYASVARTLMTDGFVAPVQLKMGLEEVLIVAAAFRVKLTMPDGEKIEANLADQFVNILKVHGKIYLKGEVITTVEPEEGEEMSFIQKAKSMGLDTGREEIRAKLQVRYPDWNDIRILTETERLYAAKGGRK